MSNYELPFRPSNPDSHPVSLDEMMREEFDVKMARGVAQAKTIEVLEEMVRELEKDS